MPHVYGRLLGKGLAYRLNAWASGIEGDRVSVFNLYTGAADTLEGVDTVVLATGPKANDELYFALKGTVENLHRIGDCVAPRKLDHAIYEGELAGRELWSPEERYIYEGELERWEEATVGGGRVARGEHRTDESEVGERGGARGPRRSSATIAEGRSTAPTPAAMATNAATLTPFR